MSHCILHDKELHDQLDLLLSYPEIREMAQYTQHGDTTCLAHCLAVTYASYRLADRLNLHVDKSSLIRGALLHDFFLYDWHDKSAHRHFHGFIHPRVALDNALRLFELTEIEKDIIAHHMWPLTPIPPHTKEAYIVNFMDKWCSIKETIKQSAFRRFMVKMSFFYK